MGIAALILASVGLVLGLGPLWPRGQALALIVAAAGVLPAGCALALALVGRTRALKERRQLGLHTAALALAVSSTLLCTVWLASILWVLARHPGPAPGKSRPVDTVPPAAQS